MKEILGRETQNTVNNKTLQFNIFLFAYLHSLYNYLTFKVFRKPPQLVSTILFERNTDQAACVGQEVLFC